MKTCLLTFLLTVAMLCEVPAASDSESPFTREMICRAAIATIFARDVSTIAVDRVVENVVWLSYVRPSDGSRWVNRCRLDGSRVIWASETGRWRNLKEDSVITFLKTRSALRIRERFPDGESVLKDFKVTDLRPE